MDTVEAIHTRQSIRSFDASPVDRALVEAILFDAAQAPPPFVDHKPAPWTFHVLEGVERIADYGERAKSYVRKNGGGLGGPILTDDNFKAFWNAPVVIVISGSAEDCARAASTLQLSAHVRGLGTCWVGSPMPWLRSAETRKELGFAEEPGAALCLGYVKDRPPPASRHKPNITWA